VLLLNVSLAGSLARLGRSGYQKNLERDLHRVASKLGLDVPLARMELTIIDVKVGRKGWA